MAVLKFVALVLMGCWVVKLVAATLSPFLPGLTVVFIVMVIVVTLFRRWHL